MEARMRENTGGDYVSVAVRESQDSSVPFFIAGNAGSEAITNLFLSSPVGLTIPSMGQFTFDATFGAPNAIVLHPTVVGGPANYQWSTNSGGATPYVAFTGQTNILLTLPNNMNSYNGINFAL